MFNFLSNMFTSGLNFASQQQQINSQNALNNWQKQQYSGRNDAVLQALVNSNYGLNDLTNSYINNASIGNGKTPLSFENWLLENNLNDVYYKENTQNSLTDDPLSPQANSLNNDRKNIEKRYNEYLNSDDFKKSMFNTDDFITLYNIGMQEKLMEREDSAIQRAVADMEKAGINPLVYAGAGSSASGYTVSGGNNQPPSNLNAMPFNNISGNFGDPTEMLKNLAEIKNIEADTDKKVSEKKEVDSKALLNGSMLDLNHDQARLYRQQVHNLASELPLNNIKKDILLQEYAGLQWNLSVAKRYDLPVSSTVPTAVYGINHIVDGIGLDNNSTAGLGSIALGVATIIPFFAGARLAYGAGSMLFNMLKSKFGKKAIDTVMKDLYDPVTGRSLYNKYLKEW